MMNNFDEAVSGEVVPGIVTTEIVEFHETTVLQAFTGKDGLKSVVDEAKELVANFEHDMSTKKGRDKTKSFAAKFPKLKTKLDGMGKDLVADWKKQAKVVDASRKSMREELDELKVIARQPLTDWEAEDERLKAEEAARLEAEKLLVQLNNDHEMGLLLNNEWNRKFNEAVEKAEREAKELAAKQEAERIERDARIAAEAAQKAKEEAEAKAKAEAERVEREKREALEREEAAKRQAEQARLDKIAAEERAKAQEELAEKARIEAAEQAKRDAAEAAENARLAEVKRQEDEAARVKAEEEKREANKRHVGFIRKTAKESLMEYVDEKTARMIVIAINDGKIPHITIKY